MTAAHVGAAHSPRTHSCPSAQAKLHRPQLAWLVKMSAQIGHVAPGGVHSICTGGQAVTQDPAAHHSPTQHARPHAPQ